MNLKHMHIKHWPRTLSLPFLLSLWLCKLCLINEQSVQCFTYCESCCTFDGPPFSWEPSPIKYETAVKWGNTTHNRKSPEQKICVLTRQSIITQRHLCCLNDQQPSSMGQVWYLPRQRSEILNYPCQHCIRRLTSGSRKTREVKNHCL